MAQVLGHYLLEKKYMDIII